MSHTIDYLLAVIGRQSKTKLFPFKAILTIALQVHNLWYMVEACWFKTNTVKVFQRKHIFLSGKKWVFRTQLALFCSPPSLCRSCKMHSRVRGKTYHVLTWPSQKCVNWWNCQISRAGRRGDCGAMQNCARPSFYDFPKMDSVLPHKHKNGQFDLIKWK